MIVSKYFATMNHICNFVYELVFVVVVLLLSSVWVFATSWTIVHRGISQAPLSVGFRRQEYCSGLPCPPPGDLPHPGIKPVSLALACEFFTIWVTREAPWVYLWKKSQKCEGCNFYNYGHTTLYREYIILQSHQPCMGGLVFDFSKLKRNFYL